MRMRQRPIVHESELQSEKVAALVDGLQSLLDAHVICLVCIDEEGAPFIAPQPGREHDVLKFLANIDWSGAQRRFEEWFA
jgi:hypothetical protein